MQHTYRHPHNSIVDDNTTYSNPVPYIEEHSHPYTNPYGPQSTHIQQNDPRYYTSLAPHLPQYQELTWNNGTHQPIENQTPYPPYHSDNLNPFAPDYSAFPPATQHAPIHHMGENSTRTLGESLGPDMSFYRAPDGPRLRTAQACQKCRTRKAKCSGDHPACERCLIKGLVCEYAAEGRVRGPNKLKTRAEPHNEFTASPSSSGQAIDSPYAFTEPSPSAHHAQVHMGGPSHSQSELRYSSGVDIERLYRNRPGVPYRSSASTHLSSTSSFPNDPSVLGAEADLRYQHSPWATPSGYERFYNHP
jgi:hypothetical protein